MFEAKYKALSVRQPWAWLICAGYKDIENRNWHLHMPPLLNYPQKTMRIYVHASSSKSEVEDKNVWAYCLRRLKQKQAAELLRPDRLVYGAIIGEVDITGCVGRSDSRWFVGPYGFVLAYPVLYERPIPCKGKLGLFEPELTEVSVYKLEVT